MTTAEAVLLLALTSMRLEIADTCMLMYPDRGIPISDFIHHKCILQGVKDERNKVQKVIDIYRGRIHRYADVMIPQIREFNRTLLLQPSELLPVCLGR